MVNGCILCDFDQLKKSKVYYEDDYILLVDNIRLYEFDERIMGLTKKHIREPSTGLKEHLINTITDIGNELFGEKKFCYHNDMRSVPEHFHLHICYPLEKIIDRKVAKTREML